MKILFLFLIGGLIFLFIVIPLIGMFLRLLGGLIGGCLGFVIAIAIIGVVLMICLRFPIIGVPILIFLIASAFFGKNNFEDTNYNDE